MGAPLLLAKDTIQSPPEPGGQVNRLVRGVVEEIGSQYANSNPIAGFMGAIGGGKLSESARESLHVCNLSDPDACKQFMNLGCNPTSSGAIPGSIECWRGGRFRLMTTEGTPLISQEPGANGTYALLANATGTSDSSLYVLKETKESASALVDENGTVLLEAGGLDCRTYARSTTPGTLNCVSGTTENPTIYPLDIERIQEMSKASINLKDAVDALEIDLCGLTVNSFASKAQKPDGFLEGMWNSFVGNGDRLEFDEIAGPGKVSVGLMKPKGGFSTVCTLAPKNDVSCNAVILSKDGIRCQNYGTVVHKLPIEKVDPNILVAVAKARIFKNRDVVGVKEILAQATRDPRKTLEVTRPDLLFSKDAKWIFPAGTGGRTGAGSGQN